ncbi:hypothetical protein [Parahaliea mediterranea]|uniref:Uncharacterized protein n=1 Tax=Parahaliea mediterranea TaxID=651086 RepID=A0A939DKL0_9GAMM|nr:hypothetical protein [Parahaliea mediterranea]MBN7799137.1 hypothetical protein [Parahaliea mediterranea]
MLRVLKAFFPSLLLTYVVASVLATASVMSSLRGMGVDVGVATQLQATWHDLLGMSSSYLLMILVAFVLALPVAALLVRLAGGWRLPLFLLAGAVALLVLHWLLSLTLQVTPVAAARTPLGLAGQCVAGALGTGLYALLSRRPADN